MTLHLIGTPSSTSPCLRLVPSNRVHPPSNQVHRLGYVLLLNRPGTPKDSHLVDSVPMNVYSLTYRPRPVPSIPTDTSLPHRPTSRCPKSTPPTPEPGPSCLLPTGSRVSWMSGRTRRVTDHGDSVSTSHLRTGTAEIDRSYSYSPLRGPSGSTRGGHNALLDYGNSPASSKCDPRVTNLV